MATTSRTGWTVDDLTALADGPAMIKELGDQVGDQIGLPSYTSGTRPSTGNYAGRIIYETDTGKTMKHTGSGWECVSQRLFQTYTPEWKDGPGGANLSAGTGSITGLYVQVGELVTYQLRLYRDTGTNTGTTGWAFSVPVSPDQSNQPLGSGYVNRGGSFMPFTVCGVGGTSVVLVTGAGGTAGAFGTRVGAAVPGSWAVGDWLVFGGTYRALTAA